MSTTTPPPNPEPRRQLNVATFFAVPIDESPLPQRRWHQFSLRTLRMDFTTFRHALINMPAQIVRGGRRIVVRLLSCSPWQPVFFRLLDPLRLPLRS